MKKITTILASLFLVFSFTSCNNESLQSYLVKSQEKKGFIAFDIPASILQLKSDGVSEEAKKALATLKKVNLVALPFKNNITEIEAEKNTIESILKKPEYKSLMRSKVKGITMGLYYTGSEEAINEVIIFGYSADKGVGIARILGENMNPSLIMKMMSDVKLDGDGIDLSQLTVLFSEAK